MEYIFSQSVRMLGLIRAITCSFSTLDSLLILYLTPVRPKLECASSVWNSMTSTDARKLECVQRKFAALCHYRFFNQNRVTYECFLKLLKLHTLHDRRLYLDVFHVLALYHTKTLITNKCTKRALSSIATHSYMFRPCWVIFREKLALPLHWGCTLQLSENVLLTMYCVVFGGVNSQARTRFYCFSSNILFVLFV
jgi:hypothetical protein